MPTFRDWIAGRTAESAIQDDDEFYVRDDSGDTSKRVTYAGLKTALDAQYAPLAGDDEAYGAGWNGATDYPTKNAVYDKVETLGVGGGDTTTMFVGAGEFAATVAVDNQRPSIIAFADSTTMTATATFHVPSTWATFNIDLWHYNPTTAAGNIKPDNKLWAPFGLGDVPVVVSTSYVNSTAFAAGGEDVTVAQSWGTSISNTGGLFSAYVRRNGADAGDTLAGPWHVLGFMLTKVS